VAVSWVWAIGTGRIVKRDRLIPGRSISRQTASSRYLVKSHGDVHVRERQRLQAMGRSLLAMHGIHVSGKWWQGKTWSKIRNEAPEWVIERLEVFSRLIAPLEAESAKLTSQIEAAAVNEDPAASARAAIRGRARCLWKWCGE
jgi:hypothetical protein